LPVAIRKETYSSKLVLKDVISGPLKADGHRFQYKEPPEGVGTAGGSLHPSTHLEGLSLVLSRKSSTKAHP
jgi:hypothetical protein